MGKEIEVEKEGDTEEGAMEDEAAGEVELDEVVGGDGGCGEGSDENLNGQHDEEEDADGELWSGYPGALIVDILGAVCITCAFDGVQGEVHHHGRD